MPRPVTLRQEACPVAWTPSGCKCPARNCRWQRAWSLLAQWPQDVLNVHRFQTTKGNTMWALSNSSSQEASSEYLRSMWPVNPFESRAQPIPKALHKHFRFIRCPSRCHEEGAPLPSFKICRNLAERAVDCSKGQGQEVCRTRV